MEKITKHIPVLLESVTNNLPLIPIKIGVDGTVGLGGHLKSLIRKTGKQTKYYAFDTDKDNLAIAKKRLNGNIEFINDNYKDFDKYIDTKIDYMILDLGISSPHIDNPLKGFSYKLDGPLDMRFNKDKGYTAKEVLETYTVQELTDIFRGYGDLKKAYSFAGTLKKTKINTTFDLVNIIKKSYSEKYLNKICKIVFQSLRIEVNNELKNLEEILPKSIKYLNKGGVLHVITYHSLEEKIVKKVFRYYNKDCHCDKKIPVCVCNFRKHIKIHRPIKPSEKEVSYNPRSRSAKLYIAEKII